MKTSSALFIFIVLSSMPAKSENAVGHAPSIWTCTAQDSKGKYFQEQRWNQASATAVVIETCEREGQKPCQFLGCFDD